jgi:carbonic anhydrase
VAVVFIGTRWLMSATDQYLRDNESYAAQFRGPLPLPPARHVAVVACMDARGIKPEWAAEAFTDLDEDVRQSIGRIKASPFIAHKDAVRGFVFDVATGRLDEVR